MELNREKKILIIAAIVFSLNIPNYMDGTRLILVNDHKFVCSIPHVSDTLDRKRSK